MKLLMVLASLFLAGVAWGSIGRAAPASYRDAVTVLDDTVLLTRAAHDHIVGEGLLEILDQAASAPVFDVETGDVVGYELSDIEPGSVYRTVGLKNHDVVLALDGTPLSDPRTAVELLRYVKTLDKFDVLIMRRGERRTIHVMVTQ